ncbi:MAG: glucosidase [Chthoniobacteraceae bacterium]|jgi:hypothetical protein
MPDLTAEHQRLADDASRKLNWKRWGPYLSERQWGTVREDYSPDGDAWNYLPHGEAPARAYRWGEDGLLGWTDRECRLCFASALWNGRDPILKERLFGLSNPQGNHGEDVKECYFYLDSSPTHSYAKALYKYPQAAFPYDDLIQENARRGKLKPEYEIQDTGIFDQNRYFDVLVEYAKAAPDDTCIRLTISNRGPAAAPLHLLPTIWFRNTWTWGCTYEESCWLKPRLQQNGATAVTGSHATLGDFRFEIETPAPWLFTENETNNALLFKAPNACPYVKDAFHDFVIRGRTASVNPAAYGTKAAPHYTLNIPPGGSVTLRMRLVAATTLGAPLAPGGFADFDFVFAARIKDADDFYETRYSPVITAEQRKVVRQGYAGMLWSKQYYHYVVREWLHGDTLTVPPPPERLKGRNADWEHVFTNDVISMPDKWEYPWFAAWDLGFHMLPFSRIDPEFAKEQLILFLREWYMHPSGKMAAYEWNFDDVNPPVHAWACWRVYKVAGRDGERDLLFLERAFQKLLINFTWWVNRKDVNGKQIFGGGFLGLDNISLFDRSQPLPNGEFLSQADGTAWMAFYCGTMLSMALELARTKPAYEDIASKFFEHFVQIVDAMNTLGGTGLWDEEDGFYYDQLGLDAKALPLRVRSLVGLVPLLACEVLDQSLIETLPGFRKRMRWFIHNRPDLSQHISYLDRGAGTGEKCVQRLLAVPSRDRLVRVLRYMLDENEFLSPFGIRSVSRVYQQHPYSLDINGQAYHIDYEPGESTNNLFGGNSNWRGPVWFPLNYLLIEAMERYHHFYGDNLKVECPVGSGKMLTLLEVARELATRISRLFLPDEKGIRPCFNGDPRFAKDPNWQDMFWFHEYFHGDTGRGLGAIHQTGWTGLIVRCMGIAGKISG